MSKERAMAQEAFVLIGAGSTVFTPGLLNDLARSRTFDGVAVRLVDVVPEAAETMARLGRRIAEAAAGTPWQRFAHLPSPRLAE